MQESVPKATYWLGTGLMLNHILEELWPLALGTNDQVIPSLGEYISDECFVASINMIHRRYLYGQVVLAKTVSECAWVGRHKEPQQYALDDITPLIVHILRACSAATITEDFIQTVDLSLKRALRKGSEESEHVDARATIGKIFSSLQELGFGTLAKDDKRYNSFSQARCVEA